MTRKALGRGLSALIRDDQPTQPPQSQPGIESIAVDLLEPNPSQPRHNFSQASLQELADSIRSSGVVQPVLVRRQGERYQLVAGERRWRAAKLAGLDSVPAIMREMDDREALEIALIENLLREDLNPLDVAGAYKALQDEFKLSHEEIAQKLGVNRSTVTNTLRLLRLSPEVQAMIRDGRLSSGHARCLLAVDSPEEQLRLANLFVKRQLSVRQAERIVQAAEHRKASGSGKPAIRQDPNVDSAQTELERTLGTKVRIVGDEKRGRIEISYFSAQDLQRVYDLIISKVA